MRLKYKIAENGNTEVKYKRPQIVLRYIPSLTNYEYLYVKKHISRSLKHKESPEIESLQNLHAE